MTALEHRFFMAFSWIFLALNSEWKTEHAYFANWMYFLPTGLVEGIRSSPENLIANTQNFLSRKKKIRKNRKEHQRQK